MLVIIKILIFVLIWVIVCFFVLMRVVIGMLCFLFILSMILGGIFKVFVISLIGNLKVVLREVVVFLICRFDLNWDLVCWFLLRLFVFILCLLRILLVNWMCFFGISDLILLVEGVFFLFLNLLGMMRLIL